MEKMKTVHIYAVLEARVPQMTPIKQLGLGLGGSKILNGCECIKEAELLTWWVQDVVPTRTCYVTCSRCGHIELVAPDAVVLDGKPLCILCSAEFQHGDLPKPRTPEDLKAQLGPVEAT